MKVNLNRCNKARLSDALKRRFAASHFKTQRLAALWPKRIIVNVSKSLEELEGEKWSKPDFDSNLAKESCRLWSVPISELSVENLRMLIGQKIGLKFLVPVAVDILAVNPLAEGAMYKGDLLASVATIPENFWQEHPELNNQVVEIKNELETIVGTIKEELVPSLGTRVYQ